MTTVATSEVLNRAADAIQEVGWGTGVTSMMGESGVCALGAIFYASRGQWASVEDMDYDAAHSCPAGQAVYRYLVESDPALDADVNTIWKWNDRRDRTASEVIEVLRAVAVVEAAREQASVEVSA